MEVATCRNCGKLFNRVTGQLLCPVCREELDGKFKEVKKYIYEHPNVGIHEVSEEMDVSVRQINHWIREEKLCFSEGSAITINCEKCGKLIRTGRFCDLCKAKMENEFASAAGLKKTATVTVQNSRDSRDNRMRFLDK